MKLKLLKDFDGNLKDAVLDFENEVEAKGLISAGIAEEFKEESEDEILEGLKAIARKEAQEEMKKQLKDSIKKSKAGFKVEDVHDNYLDDPRGACKSIGAFAKEFISAKKSGVYSDNFKKALVLSDAGNETIGADGGVLVPDDISASILAHDSVNADLNLLSKTSNLTVSGNSISIPELDNSDQSADATRFGGVVAYWLNELDSKTKSKPKFKESNYRLEKLAVLVPVSDELLEDANGLEGRINSLAGSAIVDKQNQAILAGDGVGKPQGIIGHSGTVSSPTDANRTTSAPITVAGLTGMYDRLLNKSNATWLINQELRSSISRLDFGGAPVMSGANLQGAPFQFILGIPVIWTDICKAPATEGDIILGNLSGYQSVTKGGVKSDVSMHLYFDQDATAFRFVFRMAGKPMFGDAVTPLNGVNKMSNFVTLATSV